MAETPARNPSSTVRLHTGRHMPVIGLGTWQLTRDTAGVVAAAIDLGYRMIDTSGDYGTQPGIAEALRRVTIGRDDLYMVTKVEEDEDAYASTRRQLRELRIDRADLMLIHRPPPRSPGVDVWEGLRRARDDGLTTDIGVSNYSVEQTQQLVDATGEVPAVNQIEWTPFGWSRSMLEYCNRHGIVIQAYSPLTHGERLEDGVVRELGAAHGKTAAQVLLRWAHQIGTVPLPKANDVDHQAENLAIFDFELDDNSMQRLGELNERYSSIGPSLEYA